MNARASKTAGGSVRDANAQPAQAKPAASTVHAAQTTQATKAAQAAQATKAAQATEAVRTTKTAKAAQAARTTQPAQAAQHVQQGIVIAAHGRHYVVMPAGGGAPLQCFPRGKKSEVAVGDCVAYANTSDSQGVIVAIGERRNLLYRSDQYRAKLFAANLDQLLIVLATEPYFSADLLGRALVAADANGLKPLIALNKTDVSATLSGARARLEPYRALGYPVIELSAKMQPDAARQTLGAYLHGRATLLLGQSGMGKSTLVNLLVPDAEATTREISAALNSGRHTTTFTRLYALPQSGGGTLIDSPGFQEFGLYHLTEGQLERAFPEFRALLAQCRFYNCHHLHEPGCAILQAVQDGNIARERHALYAQLVHEIGQVVR